MELVWNFDSELGSVTGVTALWNFELGSVTLKRIGFFCFPIKHSTHTKRMIGFFCFPIKHSTHTRGSGCHRDPAQAEAQ
jgi:hypothetical protein